MSATATGGGEAGSEVDVAVDGNLKLGRYTTTYQDMNVPVHSLPIQILRTYDSIDKQKRDFGIGWSLEVANIKLQTNGPLGAGGWSAQPSGCTSILGQSVCLSKTFKRLSPHFVTVRWPDGRQEVFDFTPSAGADLYYDASAAFTGRSSSTSKLEVDGDPYIQYLNDGNIYNSEMTGYFDPQRFRLTSKDGTAYVIDRDDGLISATDRHGNFLQVTHDGVISSTGKSIAFTRDTQDRITKLTGPSGEEVSYAYGPSGDLDSVTDARANTMRFTFDADHNLLVSKDPQNRPFRTIQYDDQGRMSSITDGAGNTTEIDTSLGDRQQVITSPDGRMTSVATRDDRGNLTRLQESGEGLARTSRFEYDENGNQTKSVDPIGNETISAYDVQSNLTSTTDPLGRQARFEYDANDELVKSIRPDGTVAQEITRDANGNPVEVDNGGGDVTTLSYDSAGRPTAAQDALGRFVSITYDASGNPTQYRDPAGLALTTTYDAANRPVASTNALGAITTNTYDAEGNLTRSTDAVGNYISTTFDFASRPLTMTDQRGVAMTYEYDSAGRLGRLTDKNGEQTELTYDVAGRLIHSLASDGTESTQTYDAFGRTVESQNNDARIQQTYDVAGRVTSITTT